MVHRDRVRVFVEFDILADVARCPTNFAGGDATVEIEGRSSATNQAPATRDQTELPPLLAALDAICDAMSAARTTVSR